jgi:hypothetical protein
VCLKESLVEKIESSPVLYPIVVLSRIALSDVLCVISLPLSCLLLEIVCDPTPSNSATRQGERL